MKSIFITVLMISLAAITLAEDKKEPAVENPGPTVVGTPAPGKTEPKAEPKKQPVRKAAPLDGLTFVKGKPVAIKDGKVYVVEFWASWCGPCKTTIPHLTEVQKQYKDKGVTVIGISSEEKLETVKKFVTEQGDKMNYTVAWDAKRKVDAGYMQAYGQQGIPTAFIVDGKGNVAWVGHPLEDMDAVLEKVVAGDFDPVAFAKEKAERAALQKELYQLFQQYFMAVLNGKTLDEARLFAEKFIEKGPPEALNALAWEILSLPADKRDLGIALKATAKANAQTKGENPMVLDTYAMALFENGKIAEAVTAQEKAIVLTTGNEPLQDDLKNRMKKYKDALKPAAKE